MARTNWFDDNAEVPLIDEQVRKLESFAQAMADGVVEKAELEAQHERLVKAMKAVEDDLNDELHAKVTRLLVELSAHNIMQVLHDLQVERARIAFSRT